MSNRKSACILTVALAALACAGSLQAHHSLAMFDVSKAIWVSGTVVSYQPVNPHAMIVLERKGENGQVQRLTVEGPTLMRLDSWSLAKDFLKAGDVIEVCGFPFRESRPALPALHAHMLVMPDGKMRAWGPYGKLENCIRPNDRAQAWVEFLNTQPPAHLAWCRGRSLVSVASTPSKELVDEINRSMADPCN